MYIVKNARQPDITFKANENVKYGIVHVDLLNLELIHITNIDLLGFYYIDKGLSEEQLNRVASSLLTNED